MSRAPLAVVMAGALAATLGAAGGLEACTCTNQPTLQQEFDAASVVFSGRVTDIQPAGDGENLIVTVTPLRRWKGGLDPVVILSTAATDGLCGVHYEVGIEYLVFSRAQVIPGRWFTHSCGRGGWADGNPDVQALGPPLTPTPARAKSWGGVKRLWR